jgi:hypothetical protein
MKPVSRVALVASLLFASFAFLMCGKKEEMKTGAADSTAAAMSHESAEADRGTTSAAIGSATVSINYGRPQLKGRDMLAQAGDGMIWRMGMNEATEIKTDADLKFGDAVIPKGNYSLWMKKISAGQWHLVFNKKTGIWGHEHPAADDFAETPLTMTTNAESVERFTVELSAVNATTGSLKATWGTAVLTTEFTVAATTSM